MSALQSAIEAGERTPAPTLSARRVSDELYAYVQLLFRQKPGDWQFDVAKLMHATAVLDGIAEDEAAMATAFDAGDDPFR
jgi:hypothetical protein